MSDLALLFQNFVALFMESAPWLLLGLLVAGVMHELVPISLLQKHMGKSSASAVGKAAVIGAPLPLCSCGVIPAAVGLRRSGASKPATVSFLVSTPETGVDSVSVSYALLGPLYAIVRPIAAIFSAVYAGMMVKWFVKDEEAADTASQPQEKAATSSCCSSQSHNVDTHKASSCESHKEKDMSESSCCASKPSEPTAVKTDCCGDNEVKTTESSCCSSDESANKAPQGHVFGKVGDVFSYATGKLLNDIAMWLLIGLGLAAVIQTWVPTDFLTQWGDGLVAMLVMALIGVPMYICATASTPIAVGFLGAGLSPGAVLVFLLAGPATNISTMGMIAKEMGRRTLGLYIFSVMTASIALGYLLNWAVSAFELQGLITVEHGIHNHTETQALYALCAVVLFALMLRNGWQGLQQKFAKSDKAEQGCCH